MTKSRRSRKKSRSKHPFAAKRAGDDEFCRRKLRNPAIVSKGAFEKLQQSDGAYKERREKARSSFEKYCERVANLCNNIKVVWPTRTRSNKLDRPGIAY